MEPISAQHSLLLVFSQRILVNKGDSCCIANKNFPENLHGIPQLALMTGMPVIVWLYNFSLNWWHQGITITGAIHVFILKWIKMLYSDGLVQDCSNSSAFAMELLQCCAKPSMSYISVSDIEREWVLKIQSIAKKKKKNIATNIKPADGLVIQGARTSAVMMFI